MNSPTNAIIAVTLKCNSRCRICNIWKNTSKAHSADPDLFLRLPPQLTDINITGGEPYLHPQLEKVVSNIKKTCPNSRLIINTNGLLPKLITQKTLQLLTIDPKVAIRVSLDGTSDNHNQSRGMSTAYNQAINTLNSLKKIGVSDLGVSFTISKFNTTDIYPIYKFCQKNKLEMSTTLVSDSPIYFGKNKQSLRPASSKDLEIQIHQLIKHRLRSFSPKNWLRAWFDLTLYQYYLNHQRPLPCLAAKSFFYLDPQGNVYACHIKNWKLGNLNQDTFDKIWNSSNTKNITNRCRDCQDCWMICTAKPSIIANLPHVLFATLKLKSGIWPNQDSPSSD